MQEIHGQLDGRHQMPKQMAKRARVVLLAVEEQNNREIMHEIGLDRMQVGHCSKSGLTNLRFEVGGIPTSLTTG